MKEFQAQIQESSEVIEEWYEEQCEGWKKEKACLKKNLARLSARCRREPTKIQNTVKKVLGHSQNPEVAQPVVRYVKDKRGIVQDWARNTILRLVNKGILMSRVWAVTKANAKGLGVMIVGKWSPRTSHWIVREGGIAVGLMIVEYVLSCISLWYFQLDGCRCLVAHWLQ